MTGDHVFDPQLVHQIANVDLQPHEQGCALIECDVDTRSQGLAETGVFAEFEGSRILQIGRSNVVPLGKRNGVEAGLFLLRKRVVETIIVRAQDVKPIACCRRPLP